MVVLLAGCGSILGGPFGPPDSDVESTPTPNTETATPGDVPTDDIVLRVGDLPGRFSLASETRQTAGDVSGDRRARFDEHDIVVFHSRTFVAESMGNGSTSVQLVDAWVTVHGSTEAANGYPSVVFPTGPGVARDAVDLTGETAATQVVRPGESGSVVTTTVVPVGRLVLGVSVYGSTERPDLGRSLLLTQYARAEPIVG